MTRDEFIDALADDLRAAIPTNVTLNSTYETVAFNTVLGTLNTTQPTKIPTIKHITDIQFA